MNKSFLRQILTFLFSLYILQSLAQDTSDNKVGVNHSITSQVLNETKHFQVHLPKDYHLSNKSYPVVYILDGQRFFLHAVSLYQSFNTFDETPEFIVVGIINDQASRMATFSSGGDQFLDYLQNELVPFVDEHYRTSHKRLLFGWAYAGGFGLETLMKAPNLFDGFILSSPFPVANKTEKFQQFLTNNKELSTFMFYSSYKEENGVNQGTQALTKLLKNTTSKLRWHFKELYGEEHRSTPYTTLYHGVLAYFNFYQELLIPTLSEFKELGGLSYFYDYYKRRHKLYGKNIEPSIFPKFAILRLAMTENDFKSFKLFYKDLGGENLIRIMKTSRACSVAEFFLKHNDKASAKKIFKLILEIDPNYTRAKEGLSKAM